jgi:hypothetical protein
VSVYVDSAQNSFGRMKMCHMLADTPGELFAMADKIGVARKWYQGFNKASCPHFDIAKSKRTLAIQNGAVVIERRDLVALTKKIRDVSVLCKLAGVRHGWEP